MRNNGDSRYDAVVIGSGFGGAINAFRISEAGKSVIVLERGRRWKPGDFPRDPTKTDEIFWKKTRRKRTQGLYEVRFFSGIGAVVASGVGGGSLVYANIHIRPDAKIFDDPRWPETVNRISLDPYYDKVASVMGIAPVPAHLELKKRDAFRKAATSMGKEIFDPDQAVLWEGAAPEGRQTCQHCTECEFGCQFGAKNTLDFNYLAGAESNGAEIRPGALVTHISRLSSGDGYTVHYEDFLTGEKYTATGKRVILSAGTLGTNEILFRSRDKMKTLPGLSRRLGTGYSGNGDFLGSIQNSNIPLDPWNGPDVTSVMRFFDEAPEFTMAAPSFNQATMEVLASLGQNSPRTMRLLAPLIWRSLERGLPWIFKRGMLSRPSRIPAKNAGPPGRMTNLFAIGRDNANGTVRWKKDKIDIGWRFEKENRELIGKMSSAMGKVAETYGGTYAPLVTWEIFHRILTVHSLGGCHLSDDIQRGVVSPHGEVHGYPGLFVSDGSVIPTAIGFHPVMTISAVSERIAEAVVQSFPDT